jgi:hypothetical protein
VKKKESVEEENQGGNKTNKGPWEERRKRTRK